MSFWFRLFWDDAFDEGDDIRLVAGDIIALLFIALYSSDGAGVIEP